MNDQNSQGGGNKQYPDKTPPQKTAPKSPRRKYAYFRDDQFLVLVAHNKGLKTDNALPNISKGIKASLGETQITEPHIVATFPAKNGKPALSLLKYSVTNPPDDPLHLANVVKSVNQKAGKDIIEGITLVGSSENWLSSVASQGGGTGGPGGRPTPYYGSRINAPYYFADLIANLNNNNLYGYGEGVDVAILDTAPSIHQLVAAPKEWPDHPLISTLLGPNGKLKLYPTSYADMLSLGNTSLNDHDYKMTDHGLFIAGIIHSIVPQATIHLVEVLNPFGVGDFDSFVRGLEIVSNQIQRPDRKLVVNCSWMLELPVDDLPARFQNGYSNPDAEFEQAIVSATIQRRQQGRAQRAQDDANTDPDTVEGLIMATLFEQLFGDGSQVIAAAGNDGQPYQPRVSTRYPAALTKVAGVGALPKSLEMINGKFRHSYYSNKSDWPETSGIMTLGGEEGDGNGVLGTYIGEFPDGSANNSKWAWWAGTSFATPILTGAVASVLSSAGNIDTVQNAIQELKNKNIIQLGSTAEMEAVMPVTQA